MVARVADYNLGDCESQNFVKKTTKVELSLMYQANPWVRKCVNSNVVSETHAIPS